MNQATATRSRTTPRPIVVTTEPTDWDIVVDGHTVGSLMRRDDTNSINSGGVWFAGFYPTHHAPSAEFDDTDHGGKDGAHRAALAWIQATVSRQVIRAARKG